MLSFSEISLSFRNERDEKRFPGLDRVWDYLAKRGVSRNVADICGLHVMQAVELIAAARRNPNINAVDNRAAVVFPHYKLGDKNNLIDWWSARLVALADKTELRVVASFGDIVDHAKLKTPGKMFCPPHEPPHAYLPPVYRWGGLQKGQRIYIHESAIKAINGCLLDCASIGLNGVWGWTSRKHSVALVEELRDLPWRAMNLQPVIVFDSNAHDNWQVQAAEQGLAAKLMEITGRAAVSLRVPKPVEGDQGFDDYRQLVGDEEARRFLQQEGTLIDLTPLRQMMMRLSTEVCVVRELGRIAMQDTGALMTRSVFTDVNYAHYTVEVEDGENVRHVNVPKLWIADTNRVEVGTLEYSPGADKLVVHPGVELPNLNIWRGMGCEPEPGNVDPWLELLANSVEDEELRQWIIQWCAYPLQHPGEKLNTYLLIFGPSGTGKNLFFKPLHSIYGENAVMIDSTAIRSDFTSLYTERQFVHVDELVRARSAGEDDLVSQRVKSLVTSEQLTVNRKGQPEYKIANHVNLAITSNYWDCIKLDSDDRRACVIRWEGTFDRRGDQPYWQRYVRWADSPAGAAALYDYLICQDLTGFDPSAWAPATPWKEQVKEATMTEMSMWVKDLYDDPESQMGAAQVGKALFTAKELCVLFYGRAETDIGTSQVRSMAAELRNRGFQQAYGGKPVRRPAGSLERWWCVLQRERRWTLEETQRHLKLIYGKG
jgi:hypothetical protein